MRIICGQLNVDLKQPVHFKNHSKMKVQFSFTKPIPKLSNVFAYVHISEFVPFYTKKKS